MNKVYCKYCKKPFMTETVGYRLGSFICSCPYCDQIGSVIHAYIFNNGKQQYAKVFYAI